MRYKGDEGVHDRCVVVLDAGKTHTKLTLWAPDGALVARRSRQNAVVDAGGYQALDAAAIEVWTAATLKEFAGLGHIGTVVPVGHGAAAALIRDERLACPPVDYEQPIPAATRSRYDAGRDRFSDTGSPALPEGLNLGAQLFWLEEITPSLARSDVAILPWPQYWAWLLCGVAASEVTSLGCHTDLWRPSESRPSALSVAHGWAERFAPLRRADEVLGVLRREWVARTGLPADTQVLCGLHDSNAALLAARGFPQIADHEATVVSTGTWFVAMRSRGALADSKRLDVPECRDCLVNVDAYGKLIPSARFMGGRELELLNAHPGKRLDHLPDQAGILDAVAEVVRGGYMALPTLAPGFGPYPHARHRWCREPAEPDAHRAAAGLYAALTMDTALTLIGAREVILVEGRFAEAEVFVRALAALRPDAAVYVSHAHNGVPYGALRLRNPAMPPPGTLRRVEPLASDLKTYADRWRLEAARSEHITASIWNE
jgi:sugar (pentulose or hexulose) kinase